MMKKCRYLLLAVILLSGCFTSRLSDQPKPAKTDASTSDTADSSELLTAGTAVLPNIEEVDHTIEVNGVSLYYETAGEGKPVLLVHGNGGDHTDLATEVWQVANSGHKVYAPDSRGQGENEPEEEYHYDDLAEDMYQFITQLGLDHPAYYGWSDGGIIGLLIEIHHPGTLGLLAISGTNLNVDGIDDETLEIIREDYEYTDDPLEKMMLEEPDIDPEDLRNITIPVLITVGSDDIVKPEQTQLIADSLPNSELIVEDNEDHSSYIEDSPIMGTQLISFLAEHNY